MPSTRPRAAFEPISPDFDLKALVEYTPNFEYVVRIHCDMIDHQGLENFEKLVLIHVILGGKPLVIEGYEGRLDRWTFAVQWLRDNVASKVETARDLTKKENVPLTIGHYLNNMHVLTNQWTNKNYKDPTRQRMYLKDIDCPQLWQDKLKDQIPLGLFYLNETSGDVGGLGAANESDPNGPGGRRGRGIAKAGDLMSSLPKEMRAENLMCYIGHEGTYTPAHREMCASLGQNIMVEASNGSVEDGQPTKPGSSIWFMTESKEREVVAEYWLSRLGQDIEVENHFAQINAWKNAPFKTYVVEQKPGDFILIPPLAPHQVWNRGTRTMKVAWNRTTVETLEMALNEALPKARMVCRDEQYKNKAIVYFTLQKYSALLKTARALIKRNGNKQSSRSDTKIRQLEKDFRRLHVLFTRILISETFLTNQQEKKVEMIPYEGNITCSYCRCNIFNRFLTCPSCIVDLPDGEKDTYDICMECYVMGRSCACISKLRWVEQFEWRSLTQNHDHWRIQILEAEERMTEKSPQAMRIELERLGRKRTLAQMCQIELTKRPWHDIKKLVKPLDGADEDDIELDINGKVRKKVKKARRTEAFIKSHARCHIDMHWEPKWKQASCSNCSKNYCFGLLFRAYDMMPQDVLADPEWRCPSCQNFCACRHCRTKPRYHVYTPKGTLLGHNTKVVADPRSVESLVDYSQPNISWIQKAGDDHVEGTRRMQNRRREADAAQALDPEMGDNYVHDDVERDDTGVEDDTLRLAQHEGIPIDPALGSAPQTESTTDEDELEENPENTHHSGTYTPTKAPAQYLIPEGGIIRSFEHIYDQTEAITYDYPDPEATVVAQPVPEEETLPLGYEPASAPSPRNIEMIERKRKRFKVDEGDRPCGYKKAQPGKAKKRKSLVVKSAVDKDELTGIEELAIVAQNALDGNTDAPAPTVGSELRALNAADSNPGNLPQVKKARVEHIVVDKNDEHDLSRYRGRRKVTGDGQPRRPPDADITRRTTRTQHVTYEDSSDEDDFLESMPHQSKTESKLAAMERLGISSNSEASKINEQSEPQNIRPDICINPALLQKTAQAIPTRIASQSVRNLIVRSNISGASDSSSGSSDNDNNNGRTLAEPRANRRAKTAAMDRSNDNSDEVDEAWIQHSASSSKAVKSAQIRPITSQISKPVFGAPDKSTTTKYVVSMKAALTEDWTNSDSDDSPPATGTLGGTPVNRYATAGLKPVRGKKGRA